MGNATTCAEALKECMQALGGVRTKGDAAAWIDTHYRDRWKSATLGAHLYGCSVNSPKGILHHPGFPRFLYAHGNGKYELYDPARHGEYTAEGLLAGEENGNGVQVELATSGEEEVQDKGGAAFAYEAHLRDYLARNLGILETGLALWVKDSELQSVEYDVEGRRIDILARDSNGVPVIIELKVSRGHEKTVGQCLYYRAKLKQLLKAPSVRLMIVAQELTDELRLAATEVSDLELFEYKLSMTVEKVTRASSAAQF